MFDDIVRQLKQSNKIQRKVNVAAQNARSRHELLNAIRPLLQTVQQQDRRDMVLVALECCSDGALHMFVNVADRDQFVLDCIN